MAELTEKGTLQLAIMASMLNEDGPVRGYAVMGKFDSPSGSVYPAIGRLVRAGVLQEVEAPGGFRRAGGAYAKHYDYTADGLLVASQDLAPFQVPGLDTVVRLKLSQLGVQIPE